jgi:hypothetical protein
MVLMEDQLRFLISLSFMGVTFSCPQCDPMSVDMCWKTGLSDGISAKSLGSGAVGIFIIDEYIN